MTGPSARPHRPQWPCIHSPRRIVPLEYTKYRPNTFQHQDAYSNVAAYLWRRVHRVETLVSRAFSSVVWWSNLSVAPKLYTWSSQSTWLRQDQSYSRYVSDGRGDTRRTNWQWDTMRTKKYSLIICTSVHIIQYYTYTINVVNLFIISALVVQFHSITSPSIERLMKARGGVIFRFNINVRAPSSSFFSFIYSYVHIVLTM